MKFSVDGYSRFIVNNPVLVIVLSLIWAGIAIYGITISGLPMTTAISSVRKTLSDSV